MKKIAISIVLASALIGCGGASSDKQEDSSTSTSTSTSNVVSGYDASICDGGTDAKLVGDFLVNESNEKIKLTLEDGGKGRVEGSKHKLCVSGSIKSLTISASESTILINGAVSYLKVTGDNNEIKIYGDVASANVSANNVTVTAKSYATLNKSGNNVAIKTF